jgi:hypothetical protein
MQKAPQARQEPRNRRRWPCGENALAREMLDPYGIDILYLPAWPTKHFALLGFLVLPWSQTVFRKLVEPQNLSAKVRQVTTISLP